MEGTFAGYMTDKGFLNGPAIRMPIQRSGTSGQLSNQSANITCLLQASCLETQLL